MEKTFAVDNLVLLNKLKELSNKRKFRIIELTQDEEKSITELKKEVKLAYTKCSDYCAKLENIGLVEKRKDGKEVFVKSKINLARFSNCILS